MDTQKKNLLTIGAVLGFHAVVIVTVLAQHGCKSDDTQPSTANAPVPVAPVTMPPPTPTVVDNGGFVAPTRPSADVTAPSLTSSTPPAPTATAPVVTPIAPPTPVAQFSEPLAAPTIASVASPQASSGNLSVNYIVSDKETWDSIARENKVTVDELVAANPPKTLHTILHAGDSLNIPNSKSTGTPAAAAPAGTYKVVANDSLGKIATRYHTTVKALQEMNGLKTTTIRAGQILKVPASGSVVATAAPALATAPAASTVATDGNTYKVKSNDNIDKIARAYHIPKAELESLNGLTDATAANIHVGQILKLPAGAHLTASSGSTASPTSMPSAPPPVSPTSHVSNSSSANIFLPPTPTSTSSSTPPPPSPASTLSGSGTGAPPVTPVN